MVRKRLEHHGYDTSCSFASDDLDQEPLGAVEKHAPVQESVQFQFDPDVKGVEGRENKGSIYNGELKGRSPREIIRLVKYAKMMELPLVLVYREGLSRGIDQVVRPVEYASPQDSFFEASDERGSVRRFYISKIEKFGVVEDEL
ncbi:hypothetical protein [Chitinivibrio alkaliphilus]|uniref:Uncharacterized protein n=1 Tax=Chitinivibrio alkaliphilus ACht1 TaxID=1313304 RepID=U7DEG0_9BACT|nr:hypothetical protein [Chitinivibrio alkaliphilus]ERP39306.1 hypothetical protein CALK_0100 [Chitinivibrio alkaliphilus ACht1]